MRHALKLTGISAAPLSARAEDVAAELLTSDEAFASLSAWLESDLQRLEQRFADYWTNDSLRPKTMGKGR